MSQPWATASFAALGTTATIGVTGPGELPSARRLLEDWLTEVDEACSRFRPDSELMRVNEAAGAPTRLGPVLRDALAVALRAARLTDGDVDPTIGRALRVLGYDRDFAALSPDAGPITARVGRVPGWQSVTLDEQTATLRLPAGVELDLGATAKAFAADRAAHRIATTLGTGVLVSLGGDVAVAGTPPADGWPIRVTDDHRTTALDTLGETVAIERGGLATSGTTVRRWRRDGEDLHHIVDPASGRSAAGRWRTVTVVAATCVDANTASTAAVVRGERAAPWLAELGLAARLVGHDGEVRHVGGWPAPVPT
jgi:thiamine biosynthesis lipoprotein ApbE